MASQAVARKGTLRLLFAGMPRRYVPLFLLATLLSITSGTLPPLMTRVLGDAFNFFTAYNPTGLAPGDVPQERKDELMRGILRAVWQLCALAGGTVILSTAMISAWIAVGERVAGGLRTDVYAACSTKRMSWFDGGMGLAGSAAGADGGDSSIGAGGLMARFAR